MVRKFLNSRVLLAIGLPFTALLAVAISSSASLNVNFILVHLRCSVSQMSVRYATTDTLRQPFVYHVHSSFYPHYYCYCWFKYQTLPWVCDYNLWAWLFPCFYYSYSGMTHSIVLVRIYYLSVWRIIDTLQRWLNVNTFTWIPLYTYMYIGVRLDTWNKGWWHNHHRDAVQQLYAHALSMALSPTQS